MNKKQPKDFIYNGSSYPGIVTTKTKKGKSYSATFYGIEKFTADREEPLYGMRSFNDVKIKQITANPFGYGYRVSGKKKKNVKNYLIANDLFND